MQPIQQRHRHHEQPWHSGSLQGRWPAEQRADGDRLRQQSHGVHDGVDNGDSHHLSREFDVYSCLVLREWVHCEEWNALMGVWVKV